MPIYNLPDSDELILAFQNMCNVLEENIVRRLSKGSSANNEPIWLSLEDAKQVLPIASKRKWKELRDTCQVHFTKAGKGFLYDRKSLIDYLNNCLSPLNGVLAPY